MRNIAFAKMLNLSENYRRCHTMQKIQMEINDLSENYNRCHDSKDTN